MSLPARWGYITSGRLGTEVLLQPQEQFEAERTELVTEERGLKCELGRCQAELRRPAGDEAAAPDRLAELYDRMTQGETRLREVQRQLQEHEQDRVTATDIDVAPADFEGVWNTLSPREQAQLVALVVARVEFEAAQSTVAVTEPPVPVDEMIELYQGLSLEFHDMQKLFGVGDVHGALWVNERRVGVDASLDPEQHPAKLGRYRFTPAHETGHWRLHRHLFQERANQLSLLPEDARRAEYVCRSTDRLALP